MKLKDYIDEIFSKEDKQKILSIIEDFNILNKNTFYFKYKDELDLDDSGIFCLEEDIKNIPKDIYIEQLIFWYMLNKDYIFVSDFYCEYINFNEFIEIIDFINSRLKYLNIKDFEIKNIYTEQTKYTSILKDIDKNLDKYNLKMVNFEINAHQIHISVFKKDLADKIIKDCSDIDVCGINKVCAFFNL